MEQKFAAPQGEPRPNEFGREHSALEQEIQELSREIRDKGNVEQAREIIKSRVAEKMYGSMPPTSQGVAAQPQKPKPKSSGPLPNYAQDLPAEVKLNVEGLLDLAWHKGINAAVKKVKKSDALTMDLFHDAITEKLYNEFKVRGLLK